MSGVLFRLVACLKSLELNIEFLDNPAFQLTTLNYHTLQCFFKTKTKTFSNILYSEPLLYNIPVSQKMCDATNNQRIPI